MALKTIVARRRAANYNIFLIVFVFTSGDDITKILVSIQQQGMKELGHTTFIWYILLTQYIGKRVFGYSEAKLSGVDFRHQ